MGEEGRVGGFVKKRKIEPGRGEERERGVIGNPDDALAPNSIFLSVYLCLSLSLCGGSNQPLPPTTATHTNTHTHLHHDQHPEVPAGPAVAWSL